jgi:hypothetical protein
MVVAAGADFMRPGVSNCIQLGRLEHPARLKAQAAIVTTRFMITTVRSCSHTAALHLLKGAARERPSNGNVPDVPPPSETLPRLMCAKYSK